MANVETLDFNTELNSALGHFGKFQLWNLFLIAIPAIFSGFMAGDYVFTGSSLTYRCYVAGCESDPPEYAPNWINNAIPTTAGSLDSCSRYVNISALIIQEEVCPSNLFNTNITTTCESYVYERTNSVVYDFGLECKEWLRALAGTMNSLGGMVALFIAGYMSDTFGRKTSVILFSFNIALVGFVRSFSVNYAMYVALQFLQTAIGGGAFSAAYILAAELIGAKYRVIASATISTAFALGQAFLGMIASAIYPWRTLSLVLFTPVFSLLSYYWILTESPRWLLSKNKSDKAKIVLEKAAHMNNTVISEKKMNFLLTAIPESTKSDTSIKGLLLKVYKSPVMFRRVCTTPVWWVSTTFIYYGLSINSVSLTGNMYWNYVFTCAVEIPGYWTAVFVLDRIGRKITLFCGFMLCAICCAAFVFIPDQYSGLSLATYLVGKFSIALVFTSLYLFTSELYPTRHRHSFLAFSSMIGRIGSILAPLTPPLMVYWSGIPSMLFSFMAAISAILVCTQPETLGTRLPDTFEDAENIIKIMV